MSNVVNVDFITKVVEIEVNDNETESLAAMAAVNAAKRADEKVAVAIDEIDDFTDTKKAELQVYADNAANSATAASNSASSASTTATQLMAYLEDKETLTAPAVDPTLSISGAAADAKATGDAIKSTKAEMSLFGIDDLLWDNTNPNSTTTNGVTYTVDAKNKTVTVSTGEGESTDVAYLSFFLASQGIPSWLQVGKQYYMHMHTDSDVYFRISRKINGEWYYSYTTQGILPFTIGSDVTNCVIQLYVQSGKTVNTVVRPFISEALSLGELEDGIESSMNYKPIATGTDLNDIKDVRCAFLSTNGGYINNPLDSSIAGVFRSYKTGTNTVFQIVNEAKGNVQYTRRYNATLDNWSDWVTNNKSLTTAEASMFNVQDLLWNNASFVGNTTGDVTKTVDKINRTITLTGTASAENVLNFYSDSANFPSWLQKGKTYYAHCYSSADVRFEIKEYRNGVTPSILITSVTNGVAEFKFHSDATGALIRLHILNGTATNVTVSPFISEAKSLGELTKEQTKKSIKILTLGNSGHQDMLTYVPFIMKNVAPELDLTLGIIYNSGATIANQISFFDNDSTVSAFDLYKAGATAWTISTTKTYKECLLAEDWDIIMVGQASSYQMDFSTYSGIPELIDKVTNYVATDHGDYKGHPVKFGYLGPQVRLANNNMVYIETPDTYPDYMDAVQQAMNAYPLEFAIMGATAIMNARGTTLAQYGDSVVYTDASKTTVALTGQMAYDYAHMQEGIGCMVGSYCSVLGILELAGINNKSILGESTRPNAQWISDHNIPGTNPHAPQAADVVGISDANCLIAQKCAIMAHKKPFEISTIY